MTLIDFGSSERKPGLSEVLARARQRGQVHTSMPAVVVRYDASKRKVDVQPQLMDTYLDEEDERQAISFPVCTNVPINWPGAGGYVLTFPISDGTTTVIDGAIPPATTGTLFFSERSLDRWLSGAGGQVDPEIDHTHHLSDGIFLPELRPFGASYPTTPGDHAVLGKDGGVQIHLRGTTICIGDEAGSDFVALAAKVLSELNAIKAAFNSHTHTPGTFSNGGGSVTGVSGTPNASYNPNSVAATQAKAK